MTSPKRSALARAVFVTGKGGVGKSIVAAGIAALSAHEDGEAVLVEFGDGEAGQRALGPEGYPGVKHLVIELEDAVIQAVKPMLGGSTTLTKLLVKNFAVRRVLGAAPAVREMAMLEAIRQAVEDHPGCRVIVDMPATGHGVAWLKVPEQIRAMRSPGAFHDANERLARELVTPDRCSVVIVTLPERLVVQETLQLIRELEQDVGLPCSRLVVNRVPPGFPPEALEQARALQQPDTKPEFGNALQRFQDTLELRIKAHDEAIDSLSEILLLDIKPLLLPNAGIDPDLDTVSLWLEHGDML